MPRTYYRILDELRLGEEDVLLEIGPGGGVFTGVALERAGRAAAIDHSPDMVDATRKYNARAVAEGRLEVVLGDAAKLPWPDGSFTVAGMYQVLFWLPDPEPVFREIHRVLRPGGRLAILSAQDRTPADRQRGRLTWRSRTPSLVPEGRPAPRAGGWRPSIGDR